jgi:hypothetical protein
MIQSEKHQYFKQGRHSTCVLASFAVAMSALTNIKVDDYFKDYCLHFNLDIQNMYDSYDYHFHPALTSTGKSGNQFVIDLFNNSEYNSFKLSREIVKVEYFEFQNRYIHFENKLKTKNVVSTIFMNNEGHNIVVGCDIDYKYYWFETRDSPYDDTYIFKLNSLNDICSDFGDGILIELK